MAQRIIGLDIGSYALKAVRVDSTFRSFELSSFKEIRVAADGGPTAPDIEALRAFREDEKTPPEAIVCALPGDAVMVRQVTLPFRDRKRIDEVLGFELEGHLPYPIEDVIYDYQIQALTDDGGARLVVAAVPRETLDAYLGRLKEADIDPKIVTFGPWAYGSLAPYLPTEADRATAIVDIGHRRLDVCVIVDGKPVTIRTLDHAGAHVNEVVAQQLGIEVHEADVRKRKDGRLEAGALGAPTTTDTARLHTALAAGFEAVARDIRVALLAHQRNSAVPIGRVLVCGGSTRIPGIHPFLERRLGVPVQQLDVARMEFNRMVAPDAGLEVIPKGLGLCIRALGGGAATEINVRRGPYAFQGEFRFLREKLVAVVLMVIALLGIAGFRAYTRYQSLALQKDQQMAELEAVAQEVLGRSSDSFETVIARLRSEAEFIDNPFPDIDAFDLMFEITTALDETNRQPRKTASEGGSGTDDEEGSGIRRVPKPPGTPPKDEDEDEEAEAGGADDASDRPEDRYIIELEALRIDKATGTLKGQANDIEAYEVFFQRLKDIHCLRKVETQDTDIVTFQRHTGWRQFQIKFNVDCSPRKAATKAPAKPGDKAPDKAGDKAGGKPAGEPEDQPAKPADKTPAAASTKPDGAKGAKGAGEAAGAAPAAGPAAEE